MRVKSACHEPLLSSCCPCHCCIPHFDVGGQTTVQGGTVKPACHDPLFFQNVYNNVYVRGVTGALARSPAGVTGGIRRKRREGKERKAGGGGEARGRTIGCAPRQTGGARERGQPGDSGPSAILLTALHLSAKNKSN